jgi:ABC-type antimicrobial peptide transport system permease subunit
MRLATLAFRSASFYRRTNAAVVLGIACAVAVLAGALVVGDSVRASLRELSLGRLGRTEVAVTSDAFFREALAEGLSTAGIRAVPVVLADAVATNERTGRRASRVQVVGVDDRFWAFHAIDPPRMGGSDAWLSPGLARELGFSEQDTVLVRTRRPSDIPAEFLHGRRDAVGRTIRLRGAGILPRERLGEFSLRPQQGDVRTVFVPLRRLQRDLQIASRSNVLLISGSGDRDRIATAVRERATLQDIGLRVRSLRQGELSVESEKGLLDDPTTTAVKEAAESLGLRARPMFTYVVNAIRAGERDVPYSLVTGVDSAGVALNEWAARELGSSPGTVLTLEYFVWTDEGRLATRTASVTVDRIVPIDAADPDFAPAYPGISDTGSLADWDPPFPIDLSRVRPQDEAYWDRHRTTPKLLLPLANAQELWGTRWGRVSGVRVSGTPDDLAGFEARLRDAIDPTVSGLIVVPVREQAREASAGATDFGAYFTYFSFFITAAALLLAAMFFRLGIEQRLQQIGLLRAIGYSPAKIRRLFLTEAAVLALCGCAVGVLGALGYAWTIMFGLRTWWVGAVGTTNLRVHPSVLALALGAAGGIVAGLLAILYTLWALRRASPRALLTGNVSAAFAARRRRGATRRRAIVAPVAAAAAVTLSVLSLADLLPEVAGFFGAGMLVLAAALAAFGRRLGMRPPDSLAMAGRGAVSRLGLRYASWRTGRSVLSAALIASAVFLIVSVEVFRRDAPARDPGPHSGTGGAAIVAESLLPIVHHPDTDEGRESLNLTGDSSSGAVPPFRIRPFRLSEGDDASCVNLYKPQRPRIVGAPDDFIEAGRFTFSGSVGGTDAEAANPWLLLRRNVPDGAIPAIVDATSLQYVLHAKVGDEIDAGRVGANGRPVRLLVVAALKDSVLQGEIVIAESRFRRAFPDEEGYRFFLIDVEGGAGAVERVAQFTEERLADFGFDATGAVERLESFHRVENTYLSTFQALGALGLLLGTVGLGAIAVRNVLERRRELALLRAVGFRPRDLAVLVLAENALLLAVGIGAGVVASLVAVVPVLAQRGGGPGAMSLMGLILAVMVVGLASSAFAVRASTRAPLLAALRSE